MKKKNFFMLALAAIAFAACSNDDLIPGNDGGDVTIDPNGDAWVALSIKSTSVPNSRSLNDPNKIDGTQEESDVNKATAIFFNGPNGTSVVTRAVTLTAANIGTPTQDPNTTTGGTAFQIPSTSKTILLIANPDGITLPAITEGVTTFNDINAAMVAGTLTTTIAKDDQFLMTNAKGDLEPSDGSGNTTELQLYPSAAAAQGAPLTIHIDRVVAKVRVFTEGGATNTATASVYEPGWVLNVTNKKFFPVSKRMKTFNEDPSSVGGRGTCISPFDQYKIGSYRIDPNFGAVNFAEWEWNGTAGTYGDHYDYFDAADYATITWKAMNTGSEYCLENTQEELYNVHSYTTQALVKANFAPKGLKKADGTEFDVAQNVDWMIITGDGAGYYTYESILGYIEKELTNKYTDQTPATFPTHITNALNDYLLFVGLTKVTIPDDKGGDTPEVAAGKVKDLFAALETSVKNNSKGGKKSTNVAYYSAGVSYYKIMIKHDDTAPVWNKLGEFGVVRNSVYDIRISKFLNPGFPSIPDPDPDTKDETEDQYLSLEIVTNPWTWYSQSEIL